MSPSARRDDFFDRPRVRSKRNIVTAVAKGQLPLNFSVVDIAAVAAGAASATVTATGPGTPAITQNITFVNQGNWKLSRASAGLILSMF